MITLRIKYVSDRIPVYISHMQGLIIHLTPWLRYPKTASKNRNILLFNHKNFPVS